MKNLSLFVALALGIFFASCNNDDDDGTTTPTDNEPTLELVYSDSTYQFVGIAADPTSDMVVINYPRWSGPYRYGVVRMTGPTSSQPFPDEVTNMWLGGQDGENKWVCVQSVYFDKGGNLWVLDPAAPNIERVHMKNHKLVRVNKATGAFERKYDFDSVASDDSYLNDVRVDVDKQFAYITNSKEGGIVVVNLATNRMKQVLMDHYSTHSDPAYTFIVDGKELRRRGIAAKFQSDGIALTPDGRYLYYKPTTDDKLYRIETQYLRDFDLAPAVLASKVEDLGHKCSSDGMIFDDAGNLYLTDVQNYRIVRIKPSDNHSMETVVQDDRLIWPDSYTIKNDYLYVTVSQLHRQPDYNMGEDRREGPYAVYRVKL